MARLSPFNTPIFIPHLLDRRQVRAAASSMPSGQPVPLTAMTPDAAQSTPVVPERSRRTRAMTASSLRQPSSSSDESTSLALSEHTLLPTPVDARPAFVPFQLSDEQCACPKRAPVRRGLRALPRCQQMPTSTATLTCMGTPRCRSTASGDPSSATSSSRRVQRAPVARGFSMVSIGSRAPQPTPSAGSCRYTQAPPRIILCTLRITLCSPLLTPPLHRRHAPHALLSPHSALGHTRAPTSPPPHTSPIWLRTGARSWSDTTARGAPSRTRRRRRRRPTCTTRAPSPTRSRTSTPTLTLTLTLTHSTLTLTPHPHPHPHPLTRTRTLNPNQVKSEHPGATSYEVKAIIGQRWRALAEGSVPRPGRHVTHLP